jgi:FkbM family methyltransferase
MPTLSLPQAIHLLKQCPKSLDEAHAAQRKHAVQVVCQALPEPMLVGAISGVLMEIYPASDFVTSRAFLVDGLYEPPTHAFLKHVLALGDVFIDVGANIGAHAVAAANYVGDGGAVLAIEPHPEMARRLARNLQLNSIVNVRVLRCATGVERGTFKLLTHPLNPGNGWLVEAAAATPDHLSQWERRLAKRPGAGMTPLPGLGVAVPDGRPLSLMVHDVVKAPLRALVCDRDAARTSVVKIDVEGAEADILRAGEFLWDSPTPPCAVVEYEGRHSGAREAIFSFFAERGWSLFIVSCSPKGLPTYNRLREPYVASQFENVYALPPQRLGHCLRDCEVFEYDHEEMKRRYGDQAHLEALARESVDGESA